MGTPTSNIYSFLRLVYARIFPLLYLSNILCNSHVLLGKKDLSWQAFIRDIVGFLNMSGLIVIYILPISLSVNETPSSVWVKAHPAKAM